jgi:hypothetical protein
MTIKQYTKLQSYSCKDGEKKSGKLKKSEILLSFRGITFAKMNQSIRNAMWNSNYWLQNNIPSCKDDPKKSEKL